MIGRIDVPGTGEDGGSTQSSSKVVWLICALFVVGLYAGRPGAAQQLSGLETHVSADSVKIGERFTVSLVAEHPADATVVFPAAEAGPVIFEDLEVIRRGPVQKRTRAPGQRVDSVAYEVTTFALDSVRVPALPVKLVRGTDTTLASAPTRTVAVTSVVGADTKGLRGLAPLATFPRPLWSWMLLGAVVVALLGGLVYAWWRRRASTASPPEPQSTEPDQTPYEAATAWMRQLETYDLSDPEALKPFYVELSNALRTYLSRELDVAARERTTREVVQILKHRPDVPTKAAGRVQAVLELADLVKFADTRPSPADSEKALTEARAALDAIEAAPRAADAELDEGVSAPA